MRPFLDLLSAFLVSQPSAALPAEFYVEVPFRDRAEIARLRDEGLEIAGINLEKNTVTVILPEEEAFRVAMLDSVEVRQAGRPDEEFKKPEDIERILRDVENHYPHLASVEIIGRSGEDRPIAAIQLTSRFVIPEKPKKAMVIDAMHHSREVMTSEIALDIVETLTQGYEKDARVRKWLDNNVIWIVPMVNPDGNHRVWNGKTMWRKNALGGYGVDINRNYPFEWNSCNGSSGSKSSDTYRGPGPGSEPETKALMELVSRVKPKFNLSYHSFSEIVIYPFGCNPKKIPAEHRQLYEGIGKELARKIVRDSGSGTYRAGTSYELLYDVDGGSVDWMYAKEKVMAFVIEVNSSSQGFQPSYSAWRESTVKRNRAGWQYILDQLDGPELP